jgi:hypothetical protein
MPGLKFRVLLDSDHKDEVFRDVVISNESNFETFYQAIMSSFEFKGDQMASFYVSNDEWDKGHEINLMDMSYDDDALEPDQKFILVYDFMRMWIFLIELIGYEAENPSEARTVLEVGQAPKENSKEALEEDFFASGGGSEIQGEGLDEDDYGFNDYDDDYNEEDFSDFNEFEY